MTFQYKAKDKSGNTITGTVDADSPSGAAAMLREKGLLPMDIRSAGAPAAKSAEAGSAFARYLIYPLWTGVNMRALAFFFRQMATLLASGMSLSEGLRSTGSRTKGRLGRIIDEARQSVEQGHAFSETMARHPRVFSPLQFSLVRVGESGGMLESVMDRVASYLEYEMSVRRNISKMTIYPVAILIFAFAAQIGIPHITLLVFKSPIDFFRAVWPEVRLVAMWGACCIVALKLIFQFTAVKWIWDAIKIQPPILGTTARKIAMSRFSKAMALLYSAGVPIAETVVTAADATANYSIANRLKKAVPALQVGQSLTESLAKTGALIPMVMDMLAVGERTGGMDATLNKVAEYMDDEVDASLHKLGIGLLIIGILVAGIVVGSIVVKFYLGQLSGTMRQLD